MQFNFRANATALLLAFTLMQAASPLAFAAPESGAEVMESGSGDKAGNGDPETRLRRFRRNFDSQAGGREMGGDDDRFARLKQLRESGDGPVRNRLRGMQGGGLSGGIGGKGLGMPGRTPLNLTELNLSEEQKNKIKMMRSQTHAKAKELQKDIKAKRAEMRDLLFEPGSTDEQIRAKHSELRKIQGEAESLMIDDFIAIRSVLTAEQKRKLPSIKPGMRKPQPSQLGSQQSSQQASGPAMNSDN